MSKEIIGMGMLEGKEAKWYRSKSASNHAQADTKVEKGLNHRERYRLSRLRSRSYERSEAFWHI